MKYYRLLFFLIKNLFFKLVSSYPECQRLFMCSFRGFGLKAEDVSACGRPRSISAAFNSRTREKPLVLRVKSKKRSYFLFLFTFCVYA